MKPALLVILVVALAPRPARADSFDPRVMVMPVEGAPPKGFGKLARDVMDVLAHGAARGHASVARADASLADTAAIVGCDPAERACVDAVAAALNVDQLLIARISPNGDEATVEVTAVTREAEPLTQSFPMRRSSRHDDLDAIQSAIPGMLEEGEARRFDRGDPGAEPEPEPDPDPDPDPVSGPTDLSRPSSRGPLYLVAGGGAVAAIGFVFWGLAASTQGDIDDAPTETTTDLDRLAALEDRAALRANLGNAFVVVGALAALAGGAWWFHDRGERRLAITPTAEPGGAGVTVTGAW